MNYTLLAVAIAAISSNAHALQGKIVDEKGAAVESAQIKVVSSKAVHQTNQSGHFDIPVEKVDEIHIQADGFNHKVLHLHGQNTGPLTVTLSRGVLEIVDVIGIPIHASKIESSQPVSVLAGENLRKKTGIDFGGNPEK